MKQTAMMMMLDMIPHDQPALRKNAMQLLFIEHSHLVQAFNAGAVQALGMNNHFFDGEEYYKKTYPEGVTDVL